jgi:hypothetical protein
MSILAALIDAVYRCAFFVDLSANRFLFGLLFSGRDVVVRSFDYTVFGCVFSHRLRNQQATRHSRAVVPLMEFCVSA